MKRLTHREEQSAYRVETTTLFINENKYFGEAIDKLAKFENFYEDLESQLTVITAEMDKLREEDKSHSPRFKELFVKKMINNNILTMLKYYGLE